MSPANLTRAVLANAQARGGQPCLRFFRDGRWRELSWRKVDERVAAYARGLATLGRRPGDRIAIISGNRPEWALADLAGLAASCHMVGVYATLPDADVAFILGHAACRTAFVETPELTVSVATLRPQLPELEQIVTLSGRSEARAGVLDLPALAARAEGSGPLPGFVAGGHDAALVIYTLGTTGEPKGVIFTHRNILTTLEAVVAALGDVSRLRLNLSFLPLAHTLERIAGHFLPLVQGHTIAYARSLDTVADDFRAVRPDVAVAVLRVLEKVHARIHAPVRAKPAEAFTPDGFWRSGDIGRRDEDGFFDITDRKKELNVTAGGKNIAPQTLENLLGEQPLISHCLVHGDWRPYVVALLTVNRAALAASHPELASAPPADERLQQLLGAEVEEVNRQLARFEQIKAFRVLQSDFTVKSGELSQSMKLKRRVVEERYRHLLDEMSPREEG